MTIKKLPLNHKSEIPKNKFKLMQNERHSKSHSSYYVSSIISAINLNKIFRES